MLDRQLVLLWVLGLWVLIHGFIHAKRFERTVAQRLGSSFPFDAYSGALVFCTTLAMVATYPLGHLLIFHILLLQKGVSTHDFVVAVRDLEQIRATQDPHDSLGSVVSSGKASPSSCSSQGQGWCTPPRIVFDHEESIVQPEQCLSAANDVELAARSSGVESAKFPVKLSPWMLASMNRDDVLRSSMMSVSRSSIIRPALQKVDTSSKSGSDEDKDSKMAGVKETVGDHSTMAMNGIEVHSQQPPDLLKEPAGTEIVSVGCSRAQPEALIPLEGEAKTVGPRDNVLVYVLSSDGSGVSSGTLHVKKDHLDMLGGLWKSFPGWRWRQNPAFDAKLHNSAEYSGEVVSLPCTPRKSTSGLVLRQPSTGTS